MSARASPTLELANAVASARARGEAAWSLSTPSFPAPPAFGAPDASWARLSPAEGLPELRVKAQASFFGQWSLPDHRCIIAAGAKAALFAAMRATLAPGTAVILPTPAWPSYLDLCTAAMLRPVALATQAARDFAPDLDELERLARTEGAGAIILANPCNPTGRILNAEELDTIARLCRDRDMLLFLDQSFSNIIFDQKLWATSTTEITDNILLFDSFSKNHLLQGARVGATMIPERLAERVVILHQTILSAAPTPGQKLALAALDADESKPPLDAQRAIVQDFIAEMGWSAPPQQGTFYFFPAIPEIDAFVRFAKGQNVHMLTGSAFGEGCDAHIRLCFGKSEEELRKILDLLRPAT